MVAGSFMVSDQEPGPGRRARRAPSVGLNFSPLEDALLRAANKVIDFVGVDGSLGFVIETDFDSPSSNKSSFGSLPRWPWKDPEPSQYARIIPGASLITVGNRRCRQSNKKRESIGRRRRS